MSLRTARLLDLPLPDHGLPIVAFAGVMWPAISAAGRAHHSDLRRGLGRPQEVGLHLAAVTHLGARQAITGGPLVHDRWPHATIRRRGRRGDHRRDQIRRVRITGLGPVERRAHPRGGTCTAVTGLQGVGSVDQPRRGWVLVPRAPAAHCQPGDRAALSWVEPQPTQGFKRGEVAEVWRALGSRPPVQELIAVCAELPSEGLACARGLRQAPLVRPPAVAGLPRPGPMRLDPGGRRLTALIEGVTAGCQHACEAVERVARGQDVGGMRPLGARRVDPAAALTGAPAGIQQALGGCMGAEPVATIVHAGAVEPWVGPRKAEGLRPRQAAADGIRRLAVGEPVEIRHDHDERQAPGRDLHGTAVISVHSGPERLLITRAACRAELAREMPCGKGGPHSRRRGLWHGWERGRAPSHVAPPRLITASSLRRMRAHHEQ